MKYLSICIIFLISQNISAFEIEKIDYKKVNIHHIRMIRNSLIDFSLKVEKSTSYEETSFVKIQNLFLSPAYAADGRCFYGGWPSRMSGEVCKKPLPYGDDTWAKDQKCTSLYSDKVRSCNDLIDTTYNTCGKKNVFRCNPLIFGKDEKGQGKCINVSTKPKSLSKSCLDATRGTDSFNRQAKFLKQNPDLLDSYIDNVEDFCKDTIESTPKHGNVESCDALLERLNEIRGVVEKDAVVEEVAEKEIVKYSNKALGILDRCQKDYDKSKTGAIKKFFSSKRKSLNQMAIYGRCPNEEIASNVTSEKVNSLIKNIDNIDKGNMSVQIVRNSVETGVELTVKNLMLTMYQFGEPLDINAVMKKYPKLARSPYKQAVAKSIKDFKNAKSKDEMKSTKINKYKLLKTLKGFSSKKNGLCESINSEYKKRTKIKMGGSYPNRKVITPNFISQDTFSNSDQEQAYYDEKQIEMDNMYNEFLESDKVNVTRLMATKHFQKNIFPYGKSLSEKCAEGDIDNKAFSSIDVEDIGIAVDNYKDLMKDELDKFNDTASASTFSDYEDELQDIIKYRPYLLGKFIKKKRNNPVEQQNYAAYLCEQSRDVYSSDEFWRIGEVTAGGVGLVVSGALIATGIGSPLGAGLATVSGGLIATTTGSIVAAELVIAGVSYNNALELEQANDAGFANSQQTLNEHTIAAELISNEKTEAAILAGSVILQPLGHLAKGLKSTKVGLTVLSNGSKAAPEATILSKALKNSSAVDAKKLNDAAVDAKKLNDAATDAKKVKDAAEKAKKIKDAAEAKKVKDAAEKAKKIKDAAEAKKVKDAAEAKKIKDAAEKAKANTSSKSSFKSREDISKFIVNSNELISKLPTEAIKGRSFTSIPGIKDVMKSITGKNYSDFTNEQLRKELRKFASIFHPDKFGQGNELLKSMANKEMQIVNAISKAFKEAAK